jgi:hypothetical protein
VEHLLEGTEVRTAFAALFSRKWKAIFGCRFRAWEARKLTVGKFANLTCNFRRSGPFFGRRDDSDAISMGKWETDYCALWTYRESVAFRIESGRVEIQGPRGRPGIGLHILSEDGSRGSDCQCSGEIF